MDNQSPYMPNNWEPLPWQQSVWRTLQSQQQQGRLAHAWLVVGESGLGKRHFVQAIAASLLCEQLQPQACGQCQRCRLFSQHANPDVLTIALDDKAKQIKIDQVRVLTDFVQQTAFYSGGYQIVIMHHAHTMNTNAANALLKCLEEPQGKTLIFLVADTLSTVLPTVRSRCQLLHMPTPNEDQAHQWLGQFVHETDKQQRLLMLAQGKPLLAKTYADEHAETLFLTLCEQLDAIAVTQADAIHAAKILLNENMMLCLQFRHQLIIALIKAVHTNELPDILRDLACAQTVVKYQRYDEVYRLLHWISEQRHILLQGLNPSPQLLLERNLSLWALLLIG